MTNQNPVPDTESLETLLALVSTIEDVVCPQIHPGQACIVALKPFLFTWAIIADVTTVGYERRWCYETLADARGSLNDWLAGDDTEPSGFIRRTHATPARVP